MVETNIPSDDAPSRSDRLDQVVADYLRALESGENPSREELLTRHPDLAAELQEFFADHNRMNRLAQPLCEPTQVQAAIAAAERIRYIGDYEVLEEIARGGMGVVLKARQMTLNRIVAIKMILSGRLTSSEDVERFHTEAEAAAKLDHPGIVPIYEVGQHEGQHYFSMGFVDGQSLAGRLAEGPLPAREAAEIVRAVAGAVQYAHDHDVIHRDLKPGNILLDRQGTPRVTDFGLAKLTESGSDLTGTGQVLGTPSYMPPEQAAAQVSAVGRLSDVYSLGAILYCLLTGRPPFQAASPLETLLQVQKQEPIPPRQLNPIIPIDLDTIVLKCLDKSPARRYASARALWEELNAYLEGRPILARPISRAERFWRWCRREPTIASLSAAVAAALIAGTSVSAYFAVKERERANSEAGLAVQNGELAAEKGKLAEENRILFESEREEKAKTESQLRIATAEKLAALSYTKRSESPEVSLLLAVESGHATRHNDEGLLASSHQALLDTLGGIGGRPLVGHQSSFLGSGVTCVAISPDNRSAVTGSLDRTARVWDLTADDLSASPRVLSGFERNVSGLSFSPDGHWLLTQCSDGTARVWDLKAENPSAKPRVLNALPSSITTVAFSPDSRLVVSGSHDETAHIWDLEVVDASAAPRVLRGNQVEFHNVMISADSRWVVTHGWARPARIWDLTAEVPGATSRVLDHQGGITCVAISPDSRWIITGGYADKSARVWDLTAENPDINPRVLSGHHGLVSRLAVSANARWVVTICENVVRIWELGAGDPDADPRALTGHQQLVTAVAISPDSRWLVTGSLDGTARIWDLMADNPSANSRILSGTQSEIRSLTISPDSRWVVTESGETTACVWDLSEANPSAYVRVLRGHQGRITNLAVSSDSRWLITGSNDNTARMWDLTARHPAANPRVLNGRKDHIWSVAISPVGRWLVTGVWDFFASGLGTRHAQIDGMDTIQISDLTVENGRTTPRLLRAPHVSQEGRKMFTQPAITCVAMSSDDRWLVTGHVHNSVHVWDLTAENPTDSVRVLSGHGSQISSVAISSDGHWLVTGSGDAAILKGQGLGEPSDNTARIWDLTAEDAGANPRVLSGHQQRITSIAISPNTRWVVTGSEDGTARIWDLQAENPAATPRVVVSGGSLVRVFISANSRWLVTLNGDVRIWDLGVEDPGANPRLLSGGGREIHCAAISPDNQWLVTGNDDGTANIWALAVENPVASVRVLRGHRQRISSVAISRDSRWLLTGSEDNTARLWDLTAGDASTSGRMLGKHESGITTALFDVDNRWAVTVNGGLKATARGENVSQVSFWRWQWDDLIGIAQQVGRNFTSDEWSRYFPNEPYRKTFPGLPIPGDSN